MDETYVDSTMFENENRNEQNQENDAPEKRKGRIILKNLTKEQKNAVLSGGIGGLIGVAGGAAALYTLTSSNLIGGAEIEATPVSDIAGQDIQATIEAEPTPDPIPEEGGETVVVYTEAPFATSVNDDMTFDEAFAAARAEVGPGGIFEWHGSTYGTYYANEWDNMSDADQDQYWSSVHEATYDIEEQQFAENDIDQPSDIQSEGIIIGEADYIETVDLDGNGIIDLATVDYNGNDLPDVVIDLDGDGQMDELWVDIDPETGEFTETSEIIDLNNNTYDADQFADADIASNDSIDIYDDSDLNPDIPIDNNEDMSSYS